MRDNRNVSVGKAIDEAQGLNTTGPRNQIEFLEKELDGARLTIESQKEELLGLYRRIDKDQIRDRY